jgi:hypothetical protein
VLARAQLGQIAFGCNVRWVSSPGLRWSRARWLDREEDKVDEEETVKVASGITGDQ